MLAVLCRISGEGWDIGPGVVVVKISMGQDRQMASEARLSRERASAARQQEAQFRGQVWISQWGARSGM